MIFFPKKRSFQKAPSRTLFSRPLFEGPLSTENGGRQGTFAYFTKPMRGQYTIMLRTQINKRIRHHGMAILMKSFWVKYPVL